MLETSHIGRSPVHDRFLAEHGLSRLDPHAAQGGELQALTHLAVQFPGEHCTECAAPDCHGSCDLFERGCTGRCKRFGDGIVLRKTDVDLTPYVIEVLFRPWAQLFCIGNAWCVTRSRHRRLTKRLAVVGRVCMWGQSLLRWLPDRLQWRVTDRLRGAANRLPRRFNARARKAGACAAQTLLCVVGNPHGDRVDAEVSVSGIEGSQGGRNVRRTIALNPGWNTLRIPVAEIAPTIDLSGLFRVCLVPLLDEPKLLQVLYLGFAAGSPMAPGERDNRADATPAGKVKLVVLDLDRTVWEGILIEDPDGEHPIRPGVRQALQELDRRGILLSVVSKNNERDALQQLESLGIRHLFLHPRISWQPKSLAVRDIVKRLNIGMDSVLFVDDSPFERAEVEAALPAVRTLDAARLPDLPGMAEVDVPVTPDSSRRRQLYEAEEARREELSASRIGFEAFLRSCAMRLRLMPLCDADRDRVFELVQRTNQLNFSGRRYSRDSLANLLDRPGIAPVVMRCTDRFGDYGIVGFAIVHLTENELRINDLMFSCRVQGKRVEHAFLRFLVALARRQGVATLVCRIKRTARNAAGMQVFGECGFEERALGDDAFLARLDVQGAQPETDEPVGIDVDPDAWQPLGWDVKGP